MRRKITTKSAQTGATAVAAAAAPHAAQSPITSTAGTREGTPTAPCDASLSRGRALARVALGTLAAPDAACVAAALRAYLVGARSACGWRSSDAGATDAILDGELERTCCLGPGRLDLYPHVDVVCAALLGEAAGGLARMIRESPDLARDVAERIPDAVDWLDAYLLAPPQPAPSPILRLVHDAANLLGCYDRDATGDAMGVLLQLLTQGAGQCGPGVLMAMAGELASLAHADLEAANETESARVVAWRDLACRASRAWDLAGRCARMAEEIAGGARSLNDVVLPAVIEEVR